MHSILIYGGTFDPPHKGHLLTALTVQKEFKFDEFLFLPCKTPVLKKDIKTSTAQRLDMLRLALLPYPDFKIELSEIERSSPSYMIETLESFREKSDANLSLTLLLGMDAFLSLPKWHQWEKIIQTSNLLVIKRTMAHKESMPEQLGQFLLTHETLNKDELLNQSHGCLYFFDAGQYPVSSSIIRQNVQEQRNIQELVPYPVYQYIKTHKLYRQVL